MTTFCGDGRAFEFYEIEAVDGQYNQIAFISVMIDGENKVA